MTEIKDKDLEKVGGGVFDKPGAATFDPVTGKIKDKSSGSLTADYMPTTPGGYCEHFVINNSLYSENCCRNCTYFTKDFSGCFCMFK